MNKEVERLYKNQDDIMEKIKTLEEELDSNYKLIEEIQNSCEHSWETKHHKFEVQGHEYEVSIDECVKCGVEFWN